ncbi:zinc-binding alcohol dehydrogenase [Paenibacillus albiflavus]|uniref:Zinc-binding alcohol dehydrogenase n=1 Tax=Paenibacillus albiflavus TaxID=2545760 RepID=A0A4R4EEP0_9BACL|nr:zinc-binding alcohol dehydrogenase [Paenibacillus albiflavus]TCZ76641.1 zinc-binding alcohol dehydrogenase [Paenibacillus albiflavus]
MKAIATQSGTIMITELTKPEPFAGHVLVRTEYSAISPGTEMGFVKQASDQLIKLGYSAVGIVEQVGEGVSGIEVGERVACYGAPYVYHAQWLSVPANLTAVVPNHVDPEEAAFAGLGAIAIHALRVADLRFGESAVVVGLGTLGNIIAQIANAAAFRIAGVDLSSERATMLREQGLTHVYESQEQLEEYMADAVGTAGADAVILCASGPGEALINRSLEWIRDRGKIVIVGDLTAEFSRGLMFSKEAQVLISRAGGPGRYDKAYEKENRDYPIGHVRWTEGRNIAEYIRLLADGRISIKPLITDVFPLDHAVEAYENYKKPTKTISTLIKY